ncbi:MULTISPECIES: cell division protein FtsZ [unclassified Paracoccus (in: a-proteobacteria)]|uniref:cell division protein FtsZ n=1 Tax=unclassified Paracoccus (in: a-proteobacteria) TaxID=2688777 RepID=UPI0016002A28|nr:MULTISPECIES: cell division protein FtsZ [unclassified Paracoccus (in: a-proteobacteria)]MBB1490483.1 cell division protein FtsZ [Paracoccus sp. MC1854]MBB1497326.1 cell division protein FtsZ [Paracoccus sp. MC1862]QQO44710.1 cell division protein FtsZ [Paracoccus sp. MC1862]
MNLNLMMSDDEELRPRITVFGVGGAGGNAVNNMIEKQLDGVTFVVANTDAQALAQSRSESRIQLGPKVTEGLGAGAKPSIGAKAAEETIEDIVDHLMGAHMCFITCGMGGGTGTGAAPIIAQAAREMGILTVGVVTKPFQFEGSKRMRQADEGVENLQKVVDTLIIIPNQNLFRIANEKTTFTEAFAMADDVLYQGVKGVTDLMVRPGLINLDFADVRAVMDEMGKAMMGAGEATGDNRAVEAAEKAIANPLLDEISLHGAKGVLINITGGHDLTLFEMDEAAEKIREKVDPEANIIVGSTLDPSLDGAVRVSVVATGIDSAATTEAPAPRRGLKEPLTQHPTVGRAAAPAVPEEAPAPARRSPVMEAPAARPAPVAEELPEPAYRPTTPEPAPEPRVQIRPDTRSMDQRLNDPASDFTAPARPQSPRAEPSAAVKERLDRALNRDGSAGRPAAPEPTTAQGRMSGLGRMLNRVAGTSAEAERPRPETIAERVNDRMARARKAEADFDDLASPDAGQDNVEIPAFLRRQAN